MPMGPPRLGCGAYTQYEWRGMVSLLPCYDMMHDDPNQAGAAYEDAQFEMTRRVVETTSGITDERALHAGPVTEGRIQHRVSGVAHLTSCHVWMFVNNQGSEGIPGAGAGSGPSSGRSSASSST